MCNAIGLEGSAKLQGDMNILFANAFCQPPMCAVEALKHNMRDKTNAISRLR